MRTGDNVTDLSSLLETGELRDGHWGQTEDELNERWSAFEATRSLRSERALNFLCTPEFKLEDEIGGEPRRYRGVNLQRYLTLALAKDIGKQGDKRNPDLAHYYLDIALDKNTNLLNRNAPEGRLTYARALYVAARWQQRDGRDTPENRARIIDFLRQSVALDYRPAMSALAGLYRKAALEREENGLSYPVPELRGECLRLLIRALPDPEAYYWLARMLADEPASQAAAYKILHQAALAGYDTAIREYALWSFYGNCRRAPKPVFEVDWGQAYWAFSQLDMLTKDDVDHLQHIIPDRLPKASAFTMAQQTKLSLQPQGPYESPAVLSVFESLRPRAGDLFQNERSDAIAMRASINDYTSFKTELYAEVAARLPALTPEQAFHLLDALIQPPKASGDKAIQQLHIINQKDVDTDRRRSSLFLLDNPGLLEGDDDPINNLQNIVAAIEVKTTVFNYYPLLRAILHTEQYGKISGFLGRPGQLGTVEQLKKLHALYVRQNRLDSTLNLPAIKTVPISVATEIVTETHEVDNESVKLLEHGVYVAVKPKSDDSSEVSFMPDNQLAEINVHERVVIPGDLHLCIYLNAITLLKKVMRVKPLFFESLTHTYPIEALRDLKDHAMDYALSQENFQALALMFLTATVDDTQQVNLVTWTQNLAFSKGGLNALESLFKAILVELMQCDYLTAGDRQKILTHLPLILAEASVDPKASAKVVGVAQPIALQKLLENQFSYSVINLRGDSDVRATELLRLLMVGDWEPLVDKLGRLIFENKAQHLRVTPSDGFKVVTPEHRSLLQTVMLARQHLLGVGQPQSLLTATHLLEQCLLMQPGSEREAVEQLTLVLEIAGIYRKSTLTPPNPTLALAYYTEVLRLLAENKDSALAEKADKEGLRQQFMIAIEIATRSAIRSLIQQLDQDASLEDYPRYALWASFAVQQAPSLINECYEQIIRADDYQYQPLGFAALHCIDRCRVLGERACDWDRYLATYYCIASNNLTGLHSLIRANVHLTVLPGENEAKANLLSLAHLFATTNGCQDYRVLTMLLAATPPESIPAVVAKNALALWEPLLATAQSLLPRLPNKAFAEEFAQLKEPLQTRAASLTKPLSQTAISLLPTPRVDAGSIVVNPVVDESEKAGDRSPSK